MIRRTLLMLIVLLTLQFSWGVVAGYCTHETGRAASHWGHHPDTNPSDQLASAVKDGAADASKTSAHTHCASCAHGALSIDSLVGMAHPPVAEAAPVSIERMLSSSYTTPPERPQWAAAA